MKRILLTALIAMTVSSPVLAEKVTKAIGDVDCGRWIKDTGNMKSLNTIWLVGFMTGLNFGDAQMRNSLEKVSVQQIFLWMDNFCKANPLKTISYGGYELMDELRK